MIEFIAVIYGLSQFLPFVTTSYSQPVLLFGHLSVLPLGI